MAHEQEADDLSSAFVAELAVLWPSLQECSKTMSEANSVLQCWWKGEWYDEGMRTERSECSQERAKRA